MIADDDYRFLADKVYKVEDGNIRVGEPVAIEKDDFRSQHEFVVLDVENNPSNGMQAMAVAPIGDGGEVDTSEVVVVYAGTNMWDPQDVNTDIELIVSGSSRPHISKDTPHQFVTVPNQLETADDFYERVAARYPDAEISTTGHSLGGFLGVNIAAMHKVPSTVFNAPDPAGVQGSVMSDEDKQWIRDNQYLYNNYRIDEDFIGNTGGDELGIASYSSSRSVWWPHGIANHRFDSEGRCIDENGNFLGSRYNEYHEDFAKYVNTTHGADIAHFNDLYDSYRKRKAYSQRYVKNGSSSVYGREEIFLDVYQAQLYAATIVDVANKAADDVEELRKQADKRIDELWNEATSNASSDVLTQAEISAIFNRHRITYKEFVTSFREYTSQVSGEMEEIAKTFETTSTNINAAVNEITQADATFVQDFQTWKGQ